MLEYCPKGNLRSYLLSHEEKFKISLKQYAENDVLEQSNTVPGEELHGLNLLCVWACQVRNQRLSNICRVSK